MENNGTTAPIEEQIQPQEVQDAINSSTESEQNVKDMSEMNKEELVAYLAECLQEKSFNQLRPIVEQIKTAFYKIHNIEVKTKELEVNSSEQPVEESVPEEDSLEKRFKELLALYRTKRDQYIMNTEHEKEVNYKAKLDIIEELKKLTESPEILHSTFTKFRELQTKWKEIGLVPQNVVNDLWENYNHYTEIFYNYIKINKELRDFDLKKNLEAKTELCERAEKLIDDPSAVNSFHDLQKLHDEWREIGPVAAEYKDALWERFKEASSKINKRHQEYFDKLKEEQLENLRLKTEICEKVEKLLENTYSSHKEWDEASNQVLEIQKTWKTIGFTPKKDNTAIYERFRAACDKFFGAKHNFTDSIKKELESNLQAKIAICEEAEAKVAEINDSVDWKKVTDEIIDLQKKWKTIGPTARKYNESTWQRFRASCDKFFDAKSEHFKESENEFIKHLEEKKQLIEELKETATENLSFDFLKKVQERWTSIGFVPIKEKEAIQSQFKDIMDSLYKKLKGSEAIKRTEGFRKKVANIKLSGGKLNSEHERLVQRMKQLEGQITTLENNIGFFGNSKKAETLIKDVKSKITSAKEELHEVIEKIKIIESNNNE